MSRRFICCCTGLGKIHLFKRHGLVALAHELKERVGPETKVGLYAWNDFDCILRDLKRWKPEEVCFVCHSYGCSLAAYVSEALTTYPQIRVPKVIFTDPIWRPEIHRISKESLQPHHVIILPSNVEEAFSVRQERGILTGHRLKGEPHTVIHEEVVTGMPHWKMDSHPRFLELVMQEVLNL